MIFNKFYVAFFEIVVISCVECYLTLRVIVSSCAVTLVIYYCNLVGKYFIIVRSLIYKFPQCVIHIVLFVTLRIMKASFSLLQASPRRHSLSAASWKPRSYLGFGLLFVKVSVLYNVLI